MRTFKFLLVPAALLVGPTLSAAAPGSGLALPPIVSNLSETNVVPIRHNWRHYWQQERRKARREARRDWRRYNRSHRQYNQRYYYAPRCYWSRYYQRTICR